MFHTLVEPPTRPQAYSGLSARACAAGAHALKMSQPSGSSASKGVEAVDPRAIKLIKGVTDVAAQSDRRGWRLRPAEGLEVQWHLQEVCKSLWL
eukprot:172391-Chlamydomonas_euryale.AAC.3